MEIRLTGTQREQIAIELTERVNSACVAIYEEGPRAHLGASEIGEKCARRLVYSFRWMHREKFDGRMHRLFNRGHLEEIRIIEWLRAAGLEVFSHTNDGKQIRINENQHFGGSLDGVANLPPPMKLDMPFLLEFKTHSEKSFKNLYSSKSVKFSKFKHFCQMSEYGWKHSLKYGIYFAICKNTDKIYIEIVELDWNLAASLEQKAHGIIYASNLPGRIAASAAHIDCKFCPMVPICHHRQPAQINCRSCKHSQPIENKHWRCNKFGATIPKDEIPKGCEQWQEFGK